jgi:hypothetical protein
MICRPRRIGTGTIGKMRMKRAQAIEGTNMVLLKFWGFYRVSKVGLWLMKVFFGNFIVKLPGLVV